MASMFELHDRLRVLAPEIAEQLRKWNVLSDIGVRPAEAVARQFPDVSVDLSAAAFDAQLRAQFPDLAGVA